MNTTAPLAGVVARADADATRARSPERGHIPRRAALELRAAGFSHFRRRGGAFIALRLDGLDWYFASVEHALEWARAERQAKP
jgi:hypothetical protein